MIRGNIVKKLWFATALLVLLTLGISTLAQLWLLSNTYYQQQVDKFLVSTKEVANEIAKDLSTENISSRLDLLASSLQATVFFLNSEGQVIHIAREDTGWSGGMMHGMGMGKGNGQGFRKMLPQLNVDEIMTGKPVIKKGYHPMLNMDVITVVVPVRNKEVIVGAVVVSTPLQPIDANLRALQGVSLYSLLFGLLLAAGFSWLLSRSLSQPLLQMKEVATSMAQGDYSKRIEIIRDDEIGLLADSLNTLSHELEEKVNLICQIDNTRRDFVAGVSHELRTPLTIIQGYTEALLDQVVDSPEKQKEYLNNILEESIRLRRLANDLLDLRKIETGQVNLYKEKVDITIIFSSVVHRLESLTKEKQVTLRLSIPAQPVILEVDLDRLGQVLINLLDNALRVSPAGEEVFVNLVDTSKEIITEVRDNGPGIPESEQKLIWDKFYKIDKSRSRSGGGTGLGLSIVKQLIELHGGKITLTSLPGQGTTFRFTIPKKSH